MKLLFMFVLLQLVGCAQLIEKNPTTNDLFSVEENSARVAKQSQWQAVGRVSIQQEGKTWLAHLDWQHDESLDKLVVSASLSGTLATIYYQHGQVFVKTKEGLQQIKNNKELEQMVGFNPPVEQLKFWVRGLAVPDLVVSKDTGLLDEQRSFVQEGWAVQLKRYQKKNNIWLPYRVAVSSDRLKIKLAVEQWTN